MFTPEVYAIIREGAQRSAAAVVPTLVRRLVPRTVIDLGCGEGWWPREFAKYGCDVVAMDSTVEANHVTDGVSFCHRDLDAAPALQPPPEPFDLAVSLEVAEHLFPDGGDRLVESLASVGRVVLFSAAIPGQGGHGHVNEQWPAHWAEKFAARGLACSDDLRWMFWNDEVVEPWYRQNLLVFAPAELLQAAGLTVGLPAGVVHPVVWEHRRQRP